MEDVNIHKNYSSRISENLKEHQIINTDNVNNVWSKKRDTAIKTTIEIKKNRKKPWFNKMWEYAVRRRKVARKEWPTV